MRKHVRRFMRWALSHEDYQECMWDGRMWWTK